MCSVRNPLRSGAAAAIRLTLHEGGANTSVSSRAAPLVLLSRPLPKSSWESPRGRERGMRTAGGLYRLLPALTHVSHLSSCPGPALLSLSPRVPFIQEFVRPLTHDTNVYPAPLGVKQRGQEVAALTLKNAAPGTERTWGAGLHTYGRRQLWRGTGTGLNEAGGMDSRSTTWQQCDPRQATQEEPGASHPAATRPSPLTSQLFTLNTDSISLSLNCFN